VEEKTSNLHASFKNFIEKHLIYKDDEWSIQGGGFPGGIWHNCRTIDKLSSSYSPLSAKQCKVCKKDIPEHILVTSTMIKDN
jgi:hypothetical protein